MQNQVLPQYKFLHCDTYLPYAESLYESTVKCRQTYKLKSKKYPRLFCKILFYTSTLKSFLVLNIKKLRVIKNKSTKF